MDPTDTDLTDILSRLAMLLVAYRDKHHRDPREIHLRPIAYRAWCDAGGSDRLQNVPIRCSERLAPGFIALAKAW